MTSTTTTSKVKFTKINCPFDLDAIFTLNYNTDGLKGVLEFILEHLGKLTDETHRLDQKIVTKMMQVDK